MKDINLYIDPHKNYFLINGIKKEIPHKIYETLIADKKIIVRFSGNASEKEMNSKELLSEYIDVLNHNIWCFDFKGNFIWKIPGAYSKEQHDEYVNKHGIPLSVSYVGFIQDEQDQNTIIAFTGYGDRIFIKIDDGSVVKHDKNGK